MSIPKWGGCPHPGVPAGGHNELVDLIDGFFGQAIAARRGQVLGGVQDAGFGWVERRARVQGVIGAARHAPLGGHGIEAAAEGEGGRGQHHRLLPKEVLAQHVGDGQGRHGEGLGVAARIALEPDDVVLFGRVIGGENLQHARYGLREVGEVVAQVGLTEEEVEKSLKDYGIEQEISNVKDWYDGYRFGDSEVYNPWSILNFLQDKEY